MENKVPTRLNLLNDYLFLKVMGEKGDEEQLLGFLNAVLRRTGRDRLVHVEILENKTFTPEVIGDKSSILDLRAMSDNALKLSIEVQLRNFGNMDKRSLFYWSREYAKGLNAGQDYDELPNVIAINIVNFDFLDCGNYHSCFHLWEDTEKSFMLTDALEIHFVDMVKFRKLREKDIKNNMLHQWLSYLDPASPPELIKEILKMDAAIRKAEEKLVYISGDKEALHAYQMREMALSDWTSGINHAHKEGMREEAKEIAKNMKTGGEPVDRIMRYTRLTEQQIGEL